MIFRFFSLFLLCSNILVAQSMLLRGHVLDAKSKAYISNARVYILGGDADDATTTDGRYELDLAKGISANIGDIIEVYIYHSSYGLHKMSVPILRNLRYDFEIQIENLIAVQGLIVDAVTNNPVEGIDVALIPEEVGGALGDNPLAKSDRFGRFKFLLGKEILGNSKYAQLIFLDENKCYETKSDIFDIRPTIAVKLNKICSSTLPIIDKPSELKKNNEKLGRVYFESGDGVSRYEFKRATNRNEEGQPIISGREVKILRTKLSEGIEWYEIEYDGQKGWIEARFIEKM